MMPLKKARSKKKAAQWVGQPVIVVLKDGRQYVGMVSSIDNDVVTLSALQTDQRLPGSTSDSREKAQISGFFDSFFSESALNNGTNMLGFINGMIPNIRIGMNLLKSIMPIMGMFKAL